MEVAAYRWLVSPAAQTWLDLASELDSVSPAVVTRLRRHLSRDQVNVVCEQANLRKRAAAKFPRAAEMYFTPVGLEQATDAPVAAYKANQFPADARVADLCCGIGGDLLALAARCQAIGVDHNPAAVVIAQANLAVHGLATTPVQCTDVTDLPLADFSAWHIDPDRRPGPGRTTSLTRQLPHWNVIEELIGRCPHAAVKLAPAAEVPKPVSQQAELEWIGGDRHCKQLLLRTGDLARHPGRRSATIVSATSTAPPHTFVGTADQSVPHQRSVGSYVYEPHAALLAANIVPAVAEPLGLRSFAVVTLGGGAMWGYLTSDDVVDHPAFARFEVLGVFPFDRKQLVSAVREHDWAVREIKKRGVAETPEQIGGWLPRDGGRDVTLLVAPTSTGVRAIVARRSTSS